MDIEIIDNGEDGCHQYTISNTGQYSLSIPDKFLNLSISRCSRDLSMTAAICKYVIPPLLREKMRYDRLIFCINRGISNQTDNVVIVGGDESIKTFYFDDVVKLAAGTLYVIRFELVNGYPSCPKGCNIDNVYYDGMPLSDGVTTDNDRRRLQTIYKYSDIVVDADPILVL